ncbi:MFS transporter [Jiangella mangrovi]|uniref:YNFM family putative membrane transporter n=1 Tax=Jiangella mangrovi TaxID=1524084 RepID=A0A7W9GRW9_9ACTN|nr:MFS transporter [Jiangella mangrovi]MBB5788913.1 YNFM family putative membrane transporter [Jiangella mangrovi]
MPLARGPAAAEPPPGGYRRGSAGYRRASAAAFLAGAGTFALLYGAQAVLPLLSDDFVVSAATASLALSAATGTIAVSLLPMSSVSSRWGTSRVMTVSLAAATLVAVLVPLAPSFPVLLALRAAQGVAMAGVPALAIAYLGRTIHPSGLGGAVGLFVAGNTMGGLSGRLISAAVADLLGWRAAFAVVAVFATGCLAAFWWLLPTRADGDAAAPMRTATAARGADATAVQHVIAHLRDPVLLRLFGLSFVLMSAFVTVYNYLPYRLLAAPFTLSAAVVGLVFLAYVPGSISAGVAGRVGDRVGRRAVLWAGVLLAQIAILLTWPDVLACVVAGLVLFTVGFFGAHASASTAVSARAVRGRAQASALYLTAYYAGSSLGGSLSGLAFAAAGWTGIVAFVTCAVLLAAALVHGVRPGRGGAGPSATRA